LGVEGERIVVGIAPSDSALLPQGRSKASVEKVLNDALREASGQNLTLHFVVRPELESDQEEDVSEHSPTPAGGAPAGGAPADAGLAVEPPHGDCYDHDTLIDDALRIFEARIVQDPPPSDSAPRRSARP